MIFLAYLHLWTDSDIVTPVIFLNTNIFKASSELTRKIVPENFNIFFFSLSKSKKKGGGGGEGEEKEEKPWKGKCYNQSRALYSSSSCLQIVIQRRTEIPYKLFLLLLKLHY